MNNRRRKTSLAKIYTSHLIAGVRKGVTQGLRVRGSWRSNRNFNTLTPNLWPSTLCLSRSPRLLNQSPSAYSAGWWLPLLHLISIFSWPQFIRAPSPKPLRPGVAFPTTSPLQLSATRTQLLCNSTGSSNSTELYTRSTPTRSLKLNV